MGLYDGNKLKYIGNVGTGFDRAMLERTMKTLTASPTRKSRSIRLPVAREAHWVKPELVARVKYGQWTKDMKLRQPVFWGFKKIATRAIAEWKRGPAESQRTSRTREGGRRITLRRAGQSAGRLHRVRQTRSH